MLDQVRYLIVSPVRDERPYVEKTLHSVVEQSFLPVLWVIVDDGSTDGTTEIVRKWASRYSWIRVLRRDRSTGRQPGAGIIQAFNAGLHAAAGTEWEFIVKLDCDLSFGPDYFERLTSEFIDNPKLGIASGVYVEPGDPTEWKLVGMPWYHAVGAAKMVRRGCFEAIGGFLESRGWDTVDEIRAVAKNWETRHFPGLKIRHWKPEGSGIGLWRTGVMHGEICYLTGGGVLLLFVKLLKRLVRRPILGGAVALSWGYLRNALRRKPRLVSTDEVKCYRRMLRSRIAGALPTAATLEH